MAENILDPVKQSQRVEPPPMFGLILHNDDFTPFDFVIKILTEVCGLGEEKAFAVTKDVHVKGSGCAGIYTRDIAETKQILIMEAAQQEGHPLQATVEATK